MRERRFSRRALFLAAFFLFALIALFPLRLAADLLDLPGHGFSARDARGSIWAGAFADARIGPVPLGDVTAELNTLPLLIGRARVSLAREGDGGDPFQGAITVTRGGFGIDDFTARLPSGAAFAPLPITAIDLNDVTVAFADGRCVQAEGFVQAIVSGGASGVSLPGGFGGNIACEGDALLLPLASQSGMERLTLTLFADGRYRAGLAVRPVDDAARDMLIAGGFTAGADGYSQSTEGRF